YFSKIRKNLEYEIDGLVIKINDFSLRDRLGFTQHHPRWAIAYKFDAPLADTKVLSIVVQIGRGGRATPVANLEPVKLSGSTIARATLHNQDYVDSLEVNVGDIVTISKRGDVIPAVEAVLEKGEYPSPYKIPLNCPSCSSPLVKEGAHLFCKNDDCLKKNLATIQYFVSRGQMDIETLGDKTIEFMFDKGFIRNISDIYEFDYNKLSDYEGYKDKKIANIIESVNKSKEKPFWIVLSSLGLKDIGDKVAEVLSKNFCDIDAIIETSQKKATDVFMQIDGIGESIAFSIVKHFTNPKVIDLIKKLKDKGLNFKSEKKDNIDESELFFKNTKWVVTGSFTNFKPRDKASDLIKKFGGEVSESVSSKTTFLLCGFEAGSKLEKAKSLNVKIINEDEFVNMINTRKI
ncbi:MAG TPA: NAD-dependent DNA ligase LigA, partial [Spirochaetota bacterium]|nr:NAD-dependent DNA ligase LigA [Spirochaetota bacterium]